MKIGKIIGEGIIGVLLTLDTFIYNLIGKAFNIFMAIAGARLLSTEAYMAVANKVYLIVGVLMLFVLSYSILRAIIDPDNHTKEELGEGLVKRIVIAVVGLALVPVIFNMIYQAQGLILDNNILGGIFFNDEVLEDGTDPDSQITHIGGAVTATTLWKAFFYPSEESGKNEDEIVADPSEYLIATAGWATACAASLAATAWLWEVPVVNFLAIGASFITCAGAVVEADAYSEANNQTNGKKITLREAYSRSAAGDSFNIYVAFLNNYMEDGEITYFWLISTIVGGFALISFISFSIDMGIRAAKLAYLQIIAPIPLIMQVLGSKKELLTRYRDSVVKTFLEVFIRVSVVYIVVYIICHLTKLFGSTHNIWGSNELSGPSKYFALALLIMGLIAFCRKAPEIIAETLNIKTDGLKLGLSGLKDRLAEGGAFTAGGIIGAGFTSGFHGFTKKDVAGQKGWQRGLRRVGYGLSGIIGGAGRAAWSALGPGRKDTEPKDVQGMKDLASRASQAQDDRMRDRDERNGIVDDLLKKRKENRKAYNAANDNYRDAVRRGDKAAQTAYDNEMKALDAALTEIDQKIFENSTAGDWITNKGKKIKLWAVGSFDVSVEEAAIKMGGAAGDLQDSLRSAITAKGSDTLKAAKKDWDRLEAEEISEYKNGFTEESYNEELRKRRAGQGNSAKVRELASRIREIEGIQSLLDDYKNNPNTSITKAEAETAERKLATALAERGKLEDDVIAELNLEAKKTDAEISAENIDLQHRRSNAKKIYEMMADAEIQSKLMDPTDTEYKALVSKFLRDNMDLIDKHPNMVIKIPDSKDPVTGQIKYKDVSIKDYITDAFGSAALDGTVLATNFEVGSDVVFAKGKAHETHFTYDPKDKVYISSATGERIEPGDISARLNALMRQYPDEKLDIMTGVNRAKGTGKDMKNAIQTSESYREKKNAEREKAEGGRK